MPTRHFIGAIAFITLLLGLSPAAVRADSFTWTDIGAGITSASGTLNATSVGNGEYIVNSGTAMFNGDSMTLVAGTDDGSAQTSPSGLFIFDNVLFLSSDPVLDVDGLLFADSLGTELNIWGNGAPAAIPRTREQRLISLQAPFVEIFDRAGCADAEPSALVLLGVGLLAFTGIGLARHPEVGSRGSSQAVAQAVKFWTSSQPSPLVLASRRFRLNRSQPERKGPDFSGPLSGS